MSVSDATMDSPARAHYEAHLVAHAATSPAYDIADVHGMTMLPFNYLNS